MSSAMSFIIMCARPEFEEYANSIQSMLSNQGLTVSLNQEYSSSIMDRLLDVFAHPNTIVLHISHNAIENQEITIRMNNNTVETILVSQLVERCLYYNQQSSFI